MYLLTYLLGLVRTFAGLKAEGDILFGIANAAAIERTDIHVHVDVVIA